MLLRRGRPSTVTVQVENHGDSPATSVRLRIERAEGLHVHETLPADCRRAEGCLLGDLLPGEISRFDIPVGILAVGGPALLLVSASAEEPEVRR